MNRKKVVVAVWKEKLTNNQSIQSAKKILELTKNNSFNFDVCLAPNPFSYVSVSEVVSGSPIKLCAQNVLWHPKSGSYIGEVTTEMLKEVGCNYVIVGHSERRIHFNESNEMIAAKAIAAIKSNICPIICVGDTNEDRAAGNFHNVIREQLEGLFEKLPENISENDLMIAYEPVWAISTWRNDNPLPAGDEIQDIHLHLREVISELKSGDFAKKLSILYGGSVAPENGEDYMSKPDIDGALVGGASKTPESFVSTVIACQKGFSRRELVF